VPLRIDTGTEETKTGKVTAVFLTQFLDKGQVSQRGEVRGDKLLVRVEGSDRVKEVPWDGRVLGLYRQQRLFAERKVKPGDRFRFHNFEMPVLASVPVTVTVKEPEEVDLLRPHTEKGKVEAVRIKKKLMRVEADSGKIKVGDGDFQLPKLVSWLDDERKPVRSEFTFPGLGRVTLYRTTKAVAVQEGVAPELLPDLGLTTLVSVKRVFDPDKAREVVYRITLADDDDPKSSFVRDGRQKLGRVFEDGSFELIVRDEATPPAPAPGKVKEEFVRPNYFLDSGDEVLAARTKRIVGEEKNPWRKARKVEKWVHENMTPSSAVGFARASQVCRDLKGDCRQHAILTAALCRAAGVPARTAVGLIYVRLPDRGPVLGFHMWTEVFVDGRWRGLDATRGKGGIGPGHLKIADASWDGIQTLAPLLPVARVLGKLKVEVVRVR
jgi:hypothetical protein